MKQSTPCKKCVDSSLSTNNNKMGVVGEGWTKLMLTHVCLWMGEVKKKKKKEEKKESNCLTVLGGSSSSSTSTF